MATSRQEQTAVFYRYVAFLVLLGVKESVSVCSSPSCGPCTIPMSATFNASGSEEPHSEERLKIFSVGGWCPPTNTSEQYVQVDLGEVKNVTAMGTRAWQTDGSSLTRFKLEYRMNNTNNWTIYQEPNGTDKVFQRFPNNESTLLKITLSTGVLSRYFRFAILGRYEDLFCLEAELYEGDTSLLADLSDSAFTASGSQPSYSSPEKLRLYSVGGWCPPRNSTGQYIQIDLESVSFVRAISTREWRQINGSYTATRFNLTYSNNTEKWTLYQENGIDKVFEATPADSGKTLVKELFPTYVIARYFRILILDRTEELFCLEAELYQEEAPVMNDNYPINVTKLQGSTVKFKCGVSRCPEVNITWERQDRNETNLPSGKALTLTNVSRDDTGYYRCHAINDVGGPVESRWARLFVTVPPELDPLLPSNKTVIEGQSVTFRCNVTAGIPSPDITWKKVGNSTVLSFTNELTFPSVNRSETGTYRCKAKNGVGNAAKREAQLTVHYPPSLDALKPENKTVNEGDNLTLECLVTAALPAPNITWYKVGGSHRSFPKTANLSFISTRQDSGNYYCVVENGIGGPVNSSVATVVVQFPPELDPLLPSSKTVIEGQSVTFRCNVTAGIPSPDITWKKVGNSAVLSSTNELTLSSVNRSETGTYRCKAKNGVGNATKREAQLTVHYPPSLDASKPENKTVNEGNNLTLECLVTAALPAPNITWYKVGGSHRSFPKTANLSFVSTRQDSGNYYCVVENGIGGPVNSSVATVVVQFRPDLDEVHPQNKTVTEGQSVNFHCNSTALPTANVTWKKVDDPQKNFTTTGTNLIFNVTRNDTGFYQCTADNGVGSRKSRVAYLLVHYTPSLDSSKPESKTVNEGDLLTLQCLVTTASPAPNFTWYKVGGSHRTFPKTANLTFNSTRQDSGSYYCVVENGIGGSVNSSVAIVVVQFPPDLDGVYPQNKTIIEGQLVNFHCNSTALPAANVTWKKLESNFTATGTNLTFNVTRNDTGFYQCTADNGVGSRKSHAAYLLVHFPPSLDVINPENQTVTEGTFMTLFCNVTTAEPEPKISWKNLRDSSRVYLSGNTLTLNVSRKDSSQYICIADNGIKPSATSRVAIVDVQYPPKVVMVTTSRLTVFEGVNITLECNVTGNPAPTIKWTKGNISGAVLSSQRTLTMLHVNLTTSETYYCTATNGIGSPDSGSVVVTVVAPGSQQQYRDIAVWLVYILSVCLAMVVIALIIYVVTIIWIILKRRNPYVHQD